MVVVVLAVYAAATVQSTTSFGFALLAVPLMSLVVPTEEAVVLSVSLGLLTSTSQAVGERAHRERAPARRMLVGLAIGAPFGVALLSIATGRQLKFVLAAVIVSFLVLTLRGFELRRSSRAGEVAAGAVSGVLNTSLSTNGPPIVMALHARGLPPATFRGTVAAVLSGGNVIGVGLFAVTGHYEGHVLALVLVAVPVLVAGYLTGARLRRRFDPTAFRRLVLWLLGVTAATTLVSAVLG